MTDPAEIARGLTDDARATLLDIALEGPAFVAPTMARKLLFARLTVYPLHQHGRACLTPLGRAVAAALDPKP